MIIDSYTKETVEAYASYGFRKLKGKKPVSTLKITTAVMTVFVMLFGFLAAGVIAMPYAYSPTGRKIDKVYSVTAGGKEIAFAENRKQCKRIMENVKKHYLENAKQPENITVSPDITITEKKLDIGEHPTLETETKVVENIIDNGLITVSYTDRVKKTEKIRYKTVVKNTAALAENEKQIEKGKCGIKNITAEVTYKNGTPVKTEVLKVNVAKKAKNRVVYKGTDGSYTAEINEPLKRNGTGQEVVAYAKKFVGNPYVYGGTSLTNGTDCSGFVMLIYAHFGVSLPHSANALRNKGHGISYSEAKPGDILCFSGHCGIYIGNGRMIHAASPSQGILYGNATQQKILAVRRIMAK